MRSCSPPPHVDPSVFTGSTTLDLHPSTKDIGGEASDTVPHQADSDFKPLQVGPRTPRSPRSATMFSEPGGTPRRTSPSSSPVHVPLRFGESSGTAIAPVSTPPSKSIPLATSTTQGTVIPPLKFGVGSANAFTFRVPAPPTLVADAFQPTPLQPITHTIRGFGETTLTARHLKRRRAEKHSEAWVCPYTSTDDDNKENGCGAMFARKTLLAQHCRSHHSLKGADVDWLACRRWIKSVLTKDLTKGDSAKYRGKKLRTC